MTAPFSAEALTLSIDCSQPTIELALGSASQIKAEKRAPFDSLPLAPFDFAQGKHSTECLIGEVDALLKSQALSSSDLKQIVVSVGPGSYTGIRTAIAAALGISQARKLPLFAVSTLTARAYAALSAAKKFSIGALDLNPNEIAITILEKNGKQVGELLVPQLIAKTEFDAAIAAKNFSQLSPSVTEPEISSRSPSTLTNLIRTASAGLICALEPLYLKPINALTLEERGKNRPVDASGRIG